ncbi:MAG: type VI immunity family protein [Gammaproteobacteria bacterium]
MGALSMIPYSNYELVSEDGVQLVSLVFGFSVYTQAALASCPEAVLKVYESFFEHCPQSALRFYATESMRRHKPVTKNTFGMLPTWLKPGAPPREYICVQIKDGIHYQDASHHKFEVFGEEPASKYFAPGWPNIVSMAFPPAIDAESALQFRDLFVRACSVMPLQSGHAGFSFECSRYDENASQTHAWATSMRVPGVDICRLPVDRRAVGEDAIKGVNWLTALGADLLQQVGGMSKLREGLSSEIELIELPVGVVIQAGKMPLLGDTNRGETLPLYQQVYKLLAPLVEKASRRSLSFNLSTDYVEKTEQWFTRLSND